MAKRRAKGKAGQSGDSASADGADPASGTDDASEQADFGALLAASGERAKARETAMQQEFHRTMAEAVANMSTTMAQVVQQTIASLLRRPGENEAPVSTQRQHKRAQD